MISGNSQFDLGSILEELIVLAREQGVFIEQQAVAFNQDVVELKARNQLVSYVDREVEKKIVEKLGQLIPDSGFLCEEETLQNINKRITWIVDPLDGTTNFVHGIKNYSISIALEIENEIVLGLVYCIPNNEMFTAQKSGGAFLNGNPIQVSRRSLSESLIATGFPFHTKELVPEFLGLLSKVLMNCRGVRRLGSAAIDLAYVAAGRFDGFFEMGLNPWDAAAGKLLIEEAGGIVSDFNAQPINDKYDRIVACSNSIYNELYDTTFRELR